MSRYAQDATRLVITVDAGVGDEVQFTKYQGGGLGIEINEPWAGSTESGFGATTNITLSLKDLERLRKWLGWDGKTEK